MATPRKTDPDIVDVDALLADIPVAGHEVRLKFRDKVWTFKPIGTAPASLFNSSATPAESSYLFVTSMLADGQEPLPADTTLTEVEALVNAYTKASAGAAPGE